jgi:hypothetical protein
MPEFETYPETTLYLGSSKQELRLFLDLMSPEIWVGTSECRYCERSLNLSTTHSFKKTGIHFDYQGEGIGELAKEILTFGGGICAPVTFSAVDSRLDQERWGFPSYECMMIDAINE